MKRILMLVFAALFTPICFGQIVGAAPDGDPTRVANKIIKYNFPSCKKVSGARRGAEGSVVAICDGVKYLVFTVFDHDLLWFLGPADVWKMAHGFRC